MDKALLTACAVTNLAFAAFHVGFWRLFGWRDQLGKLSWVNRAIMQVLNIRLIYVFVLFAALQMVFPEAMLTSPLGLTLQAGIALFWLMRASEQVIFFRLKHGASAAMFAVFLATAALHGAALIAALGQG